MIKSNFTLWDRIFTARVRSTTGRYCFHRCLSVHRGGEGGSGYPPPGGVPDRVPPRGGYLTGYPPGGVWIPPGGVWVPPPGGRSGYPPGGVPGQVPPPGGSGYPPPGGTQTPGYPPGGVTWPGTPRGGTQLGQHSEYLLHSGRYASCVHAGGLSCFSCFF